MMLYYDALWHHLSGIDVKITWISTSEDNLNIC